MNLDNVYYCKECDRFTDVNYLRDKIDKSQRPKSYCYKCCKEFPLIRVSDEFADTEITIACKTHKTYHKKYPQDETCVSGLFEL